MGLRLNYDSKVVKLFHMPDGSFTLQTSTGRVSYIATAPFLHSHMNLLDAIPIGKGISSWLKCSEPNHLSAKSYRVSFRYRDLRLFRI